MEISDVFTAGGIPNITYNSRESLNLEKKLSIQLKVKGKIISITGPTKIGKTVLCKKVLHTRPTVFIQGGQINSKDDIWLHILQELKLPSSWSEESSSSKETKNTESLTGDASVSLLGVLKSKVGATGTNTEGENLANKHSRSYTALPLNSSIKELLSQDIILIIDDFHYIDKDIQTTIIRALKEPIAQGLKVILLSVPHRDHDSVKVENEMTGRVYQLKIPAWQKEELFHISNEGLKALNLQCSNEIIELLIKESYRSPHLMQEFCYHLCLENNIFEQQKELVTLNPPKDYASFFQDIVESSTSKVIYEKLVAGPSRERKERQFKDGSEGDIYQAVMIALSELLEHNSISVDQIRKKLQDLLEPHSVPAKNQISAVLKQMTKIAATDIEGEPAIDFQDDLLYIVDPFFSFYLKWCEK